MTARRRHGSFAGECVTALVVSAAAAAAATALSLVLPGGTALRIVVAGAGLAYLLRALAGSDEKTGRIVTVGAWLTGATTAWLLAPGLAAYIALHVGMLWLARSLYRHASLVEAGCDLGLSVLAVCFGAWAAVRTGSLFLAFWSFLLVTAMHVAIPSIAGRLARAPARDPEHPGDADAFTAALVSAEEAVQRMAAGR